MLRNNAGLVSVPGLILLLVLGSFAFFVINRITAADITVQSVAANTTSGSTLPFGISNPFTTEEDPNEFKPVSLRNPNGWSRYNGAGFVFRTPPDWITNDVLSIPGTAESVVIESENFKIDGLGNANMGGRVIFERRGSGVTSVNEDNVGLLSKQLSRVENPAITRINIAGNNGMLIEDLDDTPTAQIVFYGDGNRYLFKLDPVQKDEYLTHFESLVQVVSSFSYR